MCVGNRWRVKEILLKVQVLLTGWYKTSYVRTHIDFENTRIKIEAANNYILRTDPEANKGKSMC